MHWGGLRRIASGSVGQVTSYTGVGASGSEGEWVIYMSSLSTGLCSS